MKKTLKIIGIVIAVLVLVIILDLANTRRKINRGDLVKWDGKWYTKEQLKKKYPPQYYEAPARNKQEVVYAKFRQALLEDNMEEALNLMVDKNKEQYRKFFTDYRQKNGSLKLLGEVYLEGIEKEYENGNSSYYKYKYKENGNEVGSRAYFEKNYDGYWQLESI